MRLLLVLAVVVSVVVGYPGIALSQEGDRPTGLGEIPWGASEQDVIRHEGRPPDERDGHSLIWHDVQILDRVAEVHAIVHPSVGLYQGAYAWKFSGNDGGVNEALCSVMLLKLVDMLVARYGEATSGWPKYFGEQKLECGAQDVVTWNWYPPYMNIRVSGDANQREALLLVFYRNGALASRADSLDATARF